MPRAVLAACAAALCAASLIAVPTAGAEPPTYLPPVVAPISDPFRPPATPYGPGNRGVDYATEPGTAVHAAADGRVSFAGTVADAWHVTVLHPDGVRTTYSFLARVTVVMGQPVSQGDVVGYTVGELHFGARRGDAYFDPLSLFAGGPPHVRLVPFDDPLAAGPAGERSAVRQLIGGLGGLVTGTGEAAGALGTWLRDDGGQLLRTLAHYAGRFTTPAALLDGALTLAQVWQRAREASSRPCTRSSKELLPPSGRRVAVLVAGLGSDSRHASVDEVQTDALGYAAPDVVRFSYAGGRVPDATDAFVQVTARPYDASQSQTDLREEGVLLADLVESVTLAAPGVPVDLVAHSQGGLVVRLALIELEERHGVEWLKRLGFVATLGSPHSGADLATAVDAISSTVSGDQALDAVGTFAGGLDGDSIAQLSETSDLVADLAEQPVPPVVRAVSIAARGDLVVPVPRTVAPGMEGIVVPLVGLDAHSDLPGSDEATRELALAAAGLPPSCTSFASALLDHGMGAGVSLVEDLAGAVGLAAAVASNVQAA